MFKIKPTTSPSFTSLRANARFYSTYKMSNNSRYNGKVVLIAGGAGTVGSGIARAFLNEDEGASVAVPSRSEGSIQKLKGYTKGQEDRLLLINEDISTLEGANKVKDAVLSRFGKIDHVITTLGPWIQKGPVTTVTLDDFRGAIHDLCESHFIAAKAFLPVVANQQGSTYTVITGAAGEACFSPDSGLTTIGAAALFGLSLALRAEHANSPVRVNEFRIAIRIDRDEDLKHPHQHSHLKLGEAITGVVHSDKKNQIIKCYSKDDLQNLAKL